MLESILKTLSRKFTPIMDPSFSKDEYFPLDLSVSNENLDVSLLTRPNEHHTHLQELLEKNNASVAYGGYLEKRPLYDRSSYFQAAQPGDKRNIHLGLDLWCNAGTMVLSPLEGEVHSFQVNINFGDYGPTIILKHHIQGFEFHTLYGHLSLKSLQGKTVGQVINKGEVFATLGSPEINGDYAPHLHFQIIEDLQGKTGDYPGVGSQNSLAFYKENCPDPNLLLNIY